MGDYVPGRLWRRCGECHRKKFIPKGNCIEVADDDTGYTRTEWTCEECTEKAAEEHAERVADDIEERLGYAGFGGYG